MDYYIYLKRTNEYIMETDDDMIWARTKSMSHAFYDTDYNSINRIAQFVCKDKHLRMNVDVEIIGEEIVVETHRLPVGELKTLYYRGNLLSDSLHSLYEQVNKESLNEVTELAFDDLYYIIDEVEELLGWCNDNGYEWYDIEKDFGINIFKKKEIKKC